jgi:hypothetical protein
MRELRSDPAIPPLVEALSHAGLDLHEEPDQVGVTRYLVSGNTFANRELLKRHGGTWDRDRQGWAFSSFEPLRELADALPANGQVQTRGLADAPTPYEPEARSFARLRKAAQNAGHRNRLRARFLEAGAESLPDYELLELLLFFSIDVKDTKPLAKELLARFGSLGAALKADPAHLAEFHDLRKEDPAIEGYLAYRLSDDGQRDRDGCARRHSLSAPAVVGPIGIVRREDADLGDPIRPAKSARLATVTDGLAPRSTSAHRRPRSSLARSPACAIRQIIVRALGAATSISIPTSDGVGISTPTSRRRLWRPAAVIRVSVAAF